MCEKIIQPPFYNSGFYDTGAGGGGGVPYLKNILPTIGFKIVDENGYIGGDFLGSYYPNYYNNFAVVFPGADYSNMGLGVVTFVDVNETIGGRNYRLVTIGGATWIAENLDFKFSGCEIGSNGSPETPAAWYYDNDENLYGIDGQRKCGLLYNWLAVKFLNDNKSELIPGWHVPTNDDWTALINEIGGTSTAGTKLKASNVDWAMSWGGNDNYNFSVFPAGFRSDTGTFSNVGNHASFWTIDEQSTSNAYIRTFDTSAQIYLNYFQKIGGFSLRLVKD